MRRSGISLLEIFPLAIFLIAVGLLVWWQLLSAQARERDTTRKTAMNAIYYELKEIYYPEHKSYPQVLQVTGLKGIDPAYFKDPSGKVITDSSSNYRYEPTGCDGQTCTGFTLRTSLEQEADFVKSTMPQS
jgi:hypothetical protein